MPYTPEKCRIRWSYLHLQRKLGKVVSYRGTTDLKPADSASGTESDEAALAGFTPAGSNKENYDYNAKMKQRWARKKEKKEKKERQKKDKTAEQ